VAGAGADVDGDFGGVEAKWARRARAHGLMEVVRD